MDKSVKSIKELDLVVISPGKCLNLRFCVKGDTTEFDSKFNGLIETGVWVVIWLSSSVLEIGST